MNRSIPPIVKNLLIINGLMFLALYVFSQLGIADLNRLLGLYYFESPSFHIYQVITHMFMHGSLMHLVFNMYALWMFGSVLEQVWGPKRFLLYYMITGLGAAALHTFVNFLILNNISHDLIAFVNTPTPEVYETFIRTHVHDVTVRISEFINTWKADPTNTSYIKTAVAQLNNYYQGLLSIPTVGASGAVFGLLLGFGMLFPNTQLMLLFPPIPIKAKWFVIGYGAIELYLGLSQQNSNIAHFAHLGGMLFGYLLIRYWNKNRNRFY